MNPSDLIDQMLDAAIAEPLWDEPYWSAYGYAEFDDFEQNYRFASDWITNFVRALPEKGLREKMVLFWSNHFVTEFEAYEMSSFLYQYHTTLMTYAFGNFKDFTHDIGLTAAMLVYLNGAQNTAESPNENYARELYELFTLGQNNGYTQSDIVETAKALTGWHVNYEFFSISFQAGIHDNGNKTIFGQTGNWGYSDVIDILFQQHTDRIATFICQKLYRFFVNPEIDDTIISELATTFKNNNFEIAPVLRQLFKSEHFFDEHNIGSIVKSPTDALLPMARVLELPFNIVLEEEVDPDTGAVYQFKWQHYLYWGMEVMGQRMFMPIDVAGWPGNRVWLNSNNLTIGWQYLDWLTWYTFDNQPDLLRELAKQLSNFSSDPAVITMSVVDYFIPKGLQTPEAYQIAIDRFKWEIPETYYENGTWNLDWDQAPLQMVVLLQHIIRQPDFQLF